MSKTECANPLLLEWVKEWWDLARERNSKGITVYKKAYNSLKSCPLPFNHPSEAQQLHGFGPKLCDRLTDKLKEYCEENNLPMPELPHKAKKSVRKDGDEDADAPTAKKPRKTKAYVPTLRSGAYALVYALSSISEDASAGLTKAETIEIAQPHCDSSFSAPSDPTKFYTAWNSMKTLIDKDLIYEKGRPLRRYALTEEGWECAKRIRKTAAPNQEILDKFVGGKDYDDDVFIDIDSDGVPIEASVSWPGAMGSASRDVIPTRDIISDESSLPTFTPITVPPGSFTIELVLDVREVRAAKDRDYLQNELIKKGIHPIMRALELGDILWVAKLKNPAFLPSYHCDGDEVVLDWVVERKRLDDLVGSIKDGRFHEQKFRLRRSGIKNVIYIIEEINMEVGKYEEAVESAIASMQVVNGYFVKKTQKLDDTIRYLARMTAMLKDLYEGKPLTVIPTSVLTSQNYMPLLQQLRSTQPSKNFYITYPAFASLASKSESLTLRDLYLKMLMCTRGVTGEKALEIQKRWNTPHAFIRAFEEAGRAGGEEGQKRKRALVGDSMGGLVGRKKVAKVLSSKIAEVWGDA